MRREGCSPHPDAIWVFYKRARRDILLPILLTARTPRAGATLPYEFQLDGVLWRDENVPNAGTARKHSSPTNSKESPTGVLTTKPNAIAFQAHAYLPVSNRTHYHRMKRSAQQVPK